MGIDWRTFSQVPYQEAVSSMGRFAEGQQALQQRERAMNQQAQYQHGQLQQGQQKIDQAGQYQQGLLANMSDRTALAQKAENRAERSLTADIGFKERGLDLQERRLNLDGSLDLAEFALKEKAQQFKHSILAEDQQFKRDDRKYIEQQREDIANIQTMEDAQLVAMKYGDFDSVIKFSREQDRLKQSAFSFENTKANSALDLMLKDRTTKAQVKALDTLQEQVALDSKLNAIEAMPAGRSREEAQNNVESYFQKRHPDVRMAELDPASRMRLMTSYSSAGLRDLSGMMSNPNSKEAYTETMYQATQGENPHIAGLETGELQSAKGKAAADAVRLSQSTDPKLQAVGQAMVNKITGDESNIKIEGETRDLTPVQKAKIFDNLPKAEVDIYKSKQRKLDDVLKTGQLADNYSERMLTAAKASKGKMVDPTKIWFPAALLAGKAIETFGFEAPGIESGKDFQTAHKQLAFTLKQAGSMSDPEMNVYFANVMSYGDPVESMQYSRDVVKQAYDRQAVKQKFQYEWLLKHRTNAGADVAWSRYLSANPMLGADQKINKVDEDQAMKYLDTSYSESPELPPEVLEAQKRIEARGGKRISQ